LSSRNTQNFSPASPKPDRDEHLSALPRQGLRAEREPPRRRNHILNTTTTFAATIGRNWADQKHDRWIRPADGGNAQHLRLDHPPEARDEWGAKLRERFTNRPIARGIETSPGPVFSALMA